MARFAFKLPDVGEGTAEAEIVKWHVAIGEDVREEQPLVDIMTDKATVEVASPVSGRVLSCNGNAGTKVAVGAELVVFEVAGGEAAPRPVAPKAEPASRPIEREASGKALASPAVRARATSLGINIATIAATGPGGRIQHADLDAILLSRQASIPAPMKSLMGAAEDGIEDIKIFGLRRRIAERMQDAKRRIPHFAYAEEVDVTELEDLRRDLNTGKGSRDRVTLLPFLIRSLIKSIKDHPGINAHFDDEGGIIRRFKSVHAGIATQTERGLLVPVIHHAEKKDIWQLAAEINRLSEASRSGKALREDLTGSTITVTSLGALGGIFATPIINLPEVAVIGVNKIEQRPVVRGGAIVIRKMMNLSSSFDHRIVDGHDAAAFIQSVKTCLETPADLIPAPASSVGS